MGRSASSHRDGSILGGVLLLAGSCIGAGMLAVPVVTGVAGFIPSLFMFFLAWAFMTTTGLLLLEANLALGHNLSLISLAEKTLGPMGKLLCWLLFLFLFYSLSIAYIAASGGTLATLSLELFSFPLPNWVGSVFFTLVFGTVLYIGTRHVDYLNRLLMLGLFLAYALLVILGLQYVKADHLLERAWPYAFAALPVLIIAFGFHNMVPSLAMYFKGDRRRLRITVIVGSVIPLFINLLWECVILGIIPIRGRAGLMEALDHGAAATEALYGVVGHSLISLVAQLFALFAITSSFLAQSLSLIDFLADGLKIPKVKAQRLGLVLLTLIPPFLFALIYPGIFIEALNLAGGFSAVILFGIFPALMVWRLRGKKLAAAPFFENRFLLSTVIVIASAIFLLELAHELGISILPSALEAIP